MSARSLASLADSARPPISAARPMAARTRQSRKNPSRFNGNMLAFLMSDALIELTARAIYEGRNGTGCLPWSHIGKAHREPYLRDAKAAVAVIHDEKISGLEADLREAVRVAYRRGAMEWARLNYPTWAPAFAAEMRGVLADEGTREA